MFTPTLRCECAQPASDRLMRNWCIGVKVPWSLTQGAKSTGNHLKCTFVPKMIYFNKRAESPKMGSSQVQ